MTTYEQATSTEASQKRYTEVIEELVPLLANDSDIFWPIPHTHAATPYEGVLHDDTPYKLSPPKREGKHFVAIAELPQDGATFVIKHDTEAARKARWFEEVRKRYPDIAAHFPKTHGIVKDEYVGLEYMDGLSYAEILEAMRTRPDFIQSYAKSTWDFLKALATEGFYTNDVGFVSGHNVIVDEQGQNLRLMEHANILPSHYQPRTVLFRELNHVFEYTKERPLPPEKAEFIFQLFSTAFHDMGANQLYVAPRFIAPTHPHFAEYCRAQRGTLAPQEYDELVAKGEPIWISDNLYDVLPIQRQIFRPELVTAVMSGDRETFQRMLEHPRFQTIAAITDEDEMDRLRSLGWDDGQLFLEGVPPDKELIEDY